MKIKILQPQAIHELGKRENQEDTIYPKSGTATTDDRLFIVCDGMGGHEKGEVASQTVCAALAEYINHHTRAEEPLSDYTFTAALEYAFSKLDEKDSGSLKKMGTTLTFLCLHHGGCTAAHIGDSRIYHVRPSKSRLLYKSRDHSLVFELYQSGEISYEEMRTSPQKNIITRAMQPGLDNRVKADIVHITDIQPGDYFFLCSDGMLEQMEDDELVSILHSKTSDEKKRNQLIAATMDNSDNHSAYLIQIGKVAMEHGDQAQPNDEATTRCNALNIHPDVADVQNDVKMVEKPLVEKPVPTKKKFRPDLKNRRNLVSFIAVLLLAFFFLANGVIQKIRTRKENKKPETECLENVPSNRNKVESIKIPQMKNGPKDSPRQNRKERKAPAIKNTQSLPKENDVQKDVAPVKQKEQPSADKDKKTNVSTDKKKDGKKDKGDGGNIPETKTSNSLINNK